MLRGQVRLLDHMVSSLVLARKACHNAHVNSRGQDRAVMRPPPHRRQGSCFLSAQQPQYAGPAPEAHLRTEGRGPDARTFTTLGEDVARITAPLEVVVRISPTWGCVPDRYRADTALSAQGRRCSPIVRSSNYPHPARDETHSGPAGIAGSPVYPLDPLPQIRALFCTE